MSCTVSLPSGTIGTVSKLYYCGKSPWSIDRLLWPDLRAAYDSLIMLCIPVHNSEVGQLVKPILSVGESFVNGQIQVFPNRVEYHKRTRHGSIPISEASVSVEGFGFSTVKVYGKSQTFEVEYASKGDYDKLKETISRLQAGESMEPDQVRREKSEQFQKEIKEVTQDENVQGCGLIVGVIVAIGLILGLIISVVQWIINTVGGLF